MTKDVVLDRVCWLYEDDYTPSFITKLKTIELMVETKDAGYGSKTVKLYEEYDGFIGIPRHFLFMKKVPYDELIDDTVFQGMVDFPDFNGSLRSGQAQAVRTILERFMEPSGMYGGLLEARCGCLVADTMINFNRGGKGFRMSIKDAFDRWNDRSRYKWDKKIPTLVRSYNEQTGLIELNDVENIVFSGRKEVFELSLENGYKIQGTGDHRIMTDSGWRALGLISIFK